MLTDPDAVPESDPAAGSTHMASFVSGASLCTALVLHSPVEASQHSVLFAGRMTVLTLAPGSSNTRPSVAAAKAQAGEA